jgi:hypothetical protein
MLGGDVAGKAFEADEPDDTGGDDDAAPIGNVRRAVFKDVKRPEDVDGEGARKLLRWVVDDFTDRSADAGVAEQDVETAVAIDPFSDRPLDRVLVGVSNTPRPRRTGRVTATLTMLAQRVKRARRRRPSVTPPEPQAALTRALIQQSRRAASRGGSVPSAAEHYGALVTREHAP